MSSWISATFGYGLVVPSGDHDEYTPSTYVQKFVDVGEDWYEVLEAVTQTDPALSFERGYVHDYYGGAVVFAGPVVKTYETTTKVSDIPLEKHDESLRKVAELLDIPFEPGYALVVSFG